MKALVLLSVLVFTTSVNAAPHKGTYSCLMSNGKWREQVTKKWCLSHPGWAAAKPNK